MSSAGTAEASRVDQNVADLCDQAAIEASRSNDVPLDVLRAISRTETGRVGQAGLQPWPWTVNMEGVGRWFETLDEARSFVFKHFKNGARSFDVGCFQINYKWHGDAFRSIDDMFDPAINADYAAGFLLELYQELGNWADVAGAYHSRTPELANKYSARFERVRAGLTGSDEIFLTNKNGRGQRHTASFSDPSQVLGLRPLVPGGTVTLGSLVPILRQADAGLRPFVVIK